MRKMHDWIVASGVATSQALDELEREEKKRIESEHNAAWDDYLQPIQVERRTAIALLDQVPKETSVEGLDDIIRELADASELDRRLIASCTTRAVTFLRNQESRQRQQLARFVLRYRETNRARYRSHLYSESSASPLKVEPVKPEYAPDGELVDGRVILTRCFDENLRRDPRLFVLGEDVGKLGDVNLVFQGLQAKYGELRVADTGIREATIVGQAIGAAMRGLRPIADIQYLDYLLWALEPMSDVLATLRHRTAGGQNAPVIVRTRGHRLMGVWHTGSPMAMILHTCRGMHLCTPRDMTHAAGMYNTLLRGDNPAIVIEKLSGYRLKERMPSNVGDFTVPLGGPKSCGRIAT